MHSRMFEKYSKRAWIPLFCVLAIFFSRPCGAQEALWAHPGLGPQPNLSVLRDGNRPGLVVVGSPFVPGLLGLDLDRGQTRWQTTLIDRVSRPGRISKDLALFASHTGTLLALRPDDGRLLWSRTAPLARDTSATSPMLVEDSIYTLTQRGELCRLDGLGQPQASHRLNTDWNGRQAAFVPMWREASGLSFLDEAGRLRSFDRLSLQPLGAVQLETGDSEVLGGIYSASLGRLWTVELAGRLRSSQAHDGQSLWMAPVAESPELFSEAGRELAIPILCPPPQSRCLVVTRRVAHLWEAEGGQRLPRIPLPSAAVAPPLFDGSRRAWWVLCQDHLVAIPWQGGVRSFVLPLAETPYSAALAGDRLMVGTERGLVYAMTLPSSLDELSRAPHASWPGDP